MEGRWFGPAEMAARLGVSAKALRIYEQQGLVAPLRTQAGWRAYGPEQVTRLHQVLALKRLGFPLRLVRELLDGRLAQLDALLALQQQVLETRRQELHRALGLLSAARCRLASTGTLSADDLTRLTRETVMTDRLTTEQDWREAFDPLIGKHYASAQIDEMGRRRKQAYADAGYDETGFAMAWEALFEEARALKAAGDLESARAGRLVRRWTEMMSHFIQGDAEVARKTQAIWTEAMGDPALAPRLPIQPDEFAFVQRIADGMRDRGELPPSS